MKLNKVICPCKKVTKADILRAVADGATKYKDVQKITGAGSKCGKCKSDIKQFIKQIKEL